MFVLGFLLNIVFLLVAFIHYILYINIEKCSAMLMLYDIV